MFTVVCPYVRFTTGRLSSSCFNYLPPQTPAATSCVRGVVKTKRQLGWNNLTSTGLGVQTSKWHIWCGLTCFCTHFQITHSPLFLRVGRERVVVLYSKGVTLRSHISVYIPSTHEGLYHTIFLQQCVYITQHLLYHTAPTKPYICSYIPSSFFITRPKWAWILCLENICIVWIIGELKSSAHQNHPPIKIIHH